MRSAQAPQPQRASNAEDDEVYQVIAGLAAELLHISVNELSRDSILVDLGADSLNLVDLIFQLEQRYQITISPEYSVPQDQSIGTFVDLVLRR